MARDGSSGGVVRLVTIDSQGVEKECVLGRLQLFHAAAFDAGPHQFFFLHVVQATSCPTCRKGPRGESAEGQMILHL
jgi:hypothetical protein